ncbi:hypothetical protein JTE90_019090 [Oedothorax gibbosus]|uniref:Uncharacterized protein n=1 Tax=Oedothorax gibbosus TaxID=931172 RepID=A0AAV6VA14_9ARAC|nr:hypothetical protein JTE90_019090 [Oedothorax gibbosus]
MPRISSEEKTLKKSLHVAPKSDELSYIRVVIQRTKAFRDHEGHMQIMTDGMSSLRVLCTRETNLLTFRERDIASCGVSNQRHSEQQTF